MKILFIDTACKSLLISLIENSKELYTNILVSESGHSNILMSEIEKIFKDSDINTVDKFMVVNGPGSFTGLRIGITVIKTLAWYLNKKVIPVSTLRALALSCEESDYYVSLINARHGCVYAAIYDNNFNEALEEKYYELSYVKDFTSKLKGKITFCGDINLDGNICEYKINPFKVVDFYKFDDGINAHALVPSYLKKHEAEEKLEKNG